MNDEALPNGEKLLDHFLTGIGLQTALVNEDSLHPADFYQIRVGREDFDDAAIHFWNHGGLRASRSSGIGPGTVTAAGTMGDGGDSARLTVARLSAEVAVFENLIAEGAGSERLAAAGCIMASNLRAVVDAARQSSPSQPTKQQDGMTVISPSVRCPRCGHVMQCTSSDVKSYKWTRFPNCFRCGKEMKLVQPSDPGAGDAELPTMEAVRGLLARYCEASDLVDRAWEDSRSSEADWQSARDKCDRARAELLAAISRLHEAALRAPQQDGGTSTPAGQRASSDPSPTRREMREYYEDERATACHAHDDGECFWENCPQLRDGEPKTSGRHCSLDRSASADPSPSAPAPYSLGYEDGIKQGSEDAIRCAVSGLSDGALSRIACWNPAVVCGHPRSEHVEPVVALFMAGVMNAKGGQSSDPSPGGAKKRVLCGNCGVWYNAPEQDGEHGIGKCPTNLAAADPSPSTQEGGQQ